MRKRARAQHESLTDRDTSQLCGRERRVRSPKRRDEPTKYIYVFGYVIVGGVVSPNYSSLYHTYHTRHQIYRHDCGTGRLFPRTAIAFCFLLWISTYGQIARSISSPLKHIPVSVQKMNWFIIFKCTKNNFVFTHRAEQQHRAVPVPAVR